MNDSKSNGKKQKKRNRKILLLVLFFSAVLLIFATYAWLSTSINVKIKFFEMKVQSDSGLFISLDGIDYTDTLVISMDSVITDLKTTYPNHTNQWATTGLWPVSTNGIKNSNQDKFEVYVGALLRTKQFNANGSIKRILNTFYTPENESYSMNSYIAFDIFLKNASGSPKPDNLFFEKGTTITFEDGMSDEDREEMSGLINSSRIGIIKIGSTPHQSDINTIQNLKCNNNCEMVIYEPFYSNHSKNSIETALNYGITLNDGVYIPTYGIIAEGKHLEHTNGHIGTGIPLNATYFALQKTITSLEDSIFQVPNGITKARVYVWIEGQDVDSLETYSKGANINISIDFIKDLAGYD